MRVVAALGVGVLVLAALPGAEQAGTGTNASAGRPGLPVPRREPAVPFKVGETLTYDVAYSQYLVAGTAVATVVEKKPSFSSTAYYIVAEGRPLPLISKLYSLYYKMDTLFDSYTTLSQRTSLYSEEGSKRRQSATLFDRSSLRASFELNTGSVAKNEFVVPTGAQDGLALLYALRLRTFKAGDRLTVPVVDDGVVYTVGIETTGPEHLKMRLGEFDTWKLNVSVVDDQRRPVGKNIAVWMSNDVRRLPLRLTADLPVGSFGFALRDVR